MTRYSQKDEQDWILRSVEGISNGHFLDIGAYDGINYSNTRALVERGWSGVMVEAGLQAFLKLLENYADNDKVTLIHGAVGVDTKCRLVPFWNCQTTFSTTEASNRDKFIHEGFSNQFWVPSLPIHTLVFGMAIDVLSIDTEGTSVDLFKSFLMGGYCRPRCVCVEHDGRTDEVLSFAKMYGYRVAMQNEENYVLEAS